MKNEKTFSLKRESRALYIFYLLLTFVFAAAFASWLFMERDKDDLMNVSVSYEGDLERIMPDGSRVGFEDPVRFKDVAPGEMLSFETVLPDNVEDNKYICYRSAHQSVWIYKDGELILEYDTVGSKFLGNNTASRYLFVRLNKEDAGKTLHFDVLSDSHYAGAVNEIYYGENAYIWGTVFKYKGAEILIGILLWLLSTSVIIVSSVADVIFKRRSKLIYLAWSEFWVASWMLFESGFRQVIYSNSKIIACLAFLTIPLFVFSTILYIDAMQGRRFHTQYMITYVALALDVVISTFLHLTRIADVVQTMYVNYAISGLSLVFVFITIMLDVKNKRIGNYKFSFIGSMMLFVGAGIDIIRSAISVSAFSGLAIGLGGVGFMLMGIWNSAVEELQAEKERQKKQVTSQTKDMFLATMSHEIRTPINSILGMNELILRENNDDHIKEYSVNIERAGVMLLGLVNDILDFSKIGSGKMDIVIGEYSLPTMITDLETLVRERADDKGLKVIVNVDERLPVTLNGDVVRIKQIITNLLTNAVKYTEKGSVTMDVSGTEDPTMGFALKVSVKDTGQGIRDENIPKIFDYFTRLESRSNQGIEGTGLGLTITKQLCELMGGTISVVSTYGVGSIFTVVIPQWIVDSTPMGDIRDFRKKEIREEKKHEALFTAPKATVLAVDDNGVNLAVVKGLLKMTLVNVIAVKSGDEALKKVKEEDIDLILMDHMMPDKDGIESFHEIEEWLKEQGREIIPTIALTANAIAGMREMYIYEGFSDYLSKPINPDELEKILMEYLPKEKITLRSEE